jgi:hypothetical protein
MSMFVRSHVTYQPSKSVRESTRSTVCSVSVRRLRRIDPRWSHRKVLSKHVRKRTRSIKRIHLSWQRSCQFSARGDVIFWFHTLWQGARSTSASNAMIVKKECPTWRWPNITALLQKMHIEADVKHCWEMFNLIIHCIGRTETDRGHNFTHNSITGLALWTVWQTNEGSLWVYW